jgi:hypothetical protein
VVPRAISIAGPLMSVALQQQSDNAELGVAVYAFERGVLELRMPGG